MDLNSKLTKLKKVKTSSLPICIIMKVKTLTFPPISALRSKYIHLPHIFFNTMVLFKADIAL